MEIEEAIRICIRSRRRFSTTQEAIDAVKSIAVLKAGNWATVCKRARLSEHVIPGLVSQCECSAELIQWLHNRGKNVDVHSLNHVLSKYSYQGHSKRLAYQEPWKLYWGAWFLESQIPLAPE